MIIYRSSLLLPVGVLLAGCNEPARDDAALKAELARLEPEPIDLNLFSEPPPLPDMEFLSGQANAMADRQREGRIKLDQALEEQRLQQIESRMTDMERQQRMDRLMQATEALGK